MSTDSSTSSESLASSGVSSSIEKFILPPVRPVNHTKTLEPIDDSLANKQHVAEWTNEIGKLFGSVEVRENVTHLHTHLAPAIDTLKKVCEDPNEGLKQEIRKLMEHYSTMAKVCEMMVDKMEKSVSVVDNPSNEMAAAEERTK
ncbi:unnamed protein product [Caenorhabditis sp. 36 PRJEB53466]|nr:unnamed protein product [Caenorhabditis sp. 36 PRJEB53466]